APAICARPRLIVREVVPGVAAVAVVLADGAPLPLAEIRPPLPPGDVLLAGLLQSSVFGGHGDLLSPKTAGRAWTCSALGPARAPYHRPGGTVGDDPRHCRPTERSKTSLPDRGRSIAAPTCPRTVPPRDS